MRNGSMPRNKAEISSDDNRMAITNIGDCYSEMSLAVDGNSICIEIENPFQGDTETGFGQSTSTTMDMETAKAIAEWMLKRAGEA